MKKIYLEVKVVANNEVRNVAFAKVLTVPSTWAMLRRY